MNEERFKCPSLIIWPVPSVFLVLLFAARVLRSCMAFLALLLFIPAIFISILQFVLYGMISIEPVAVIVHEFASELKGIFVTICLMLIITALMVQKATRKLLIRYHGILAINEIALNARLANIHVWTFLIDS